MSGAVLQFSKFGKNIPLPLLVTVGRPALKHTVLRSYFDRNKFPLSPRAILDDRDRRILALPSYVDAEILADQSRIATVRYTREGDYPLTGWNACCPSRFNKFLERLDSYTELALLRPEALEAFIVADKTNFLAQIASIKRDESQALPPVFIATLNAYVQLTNNKVDTWSGEPIASFTDDAACRGMPASSLINTTEGWPGMPAMSIASGAKTTVKIYFDAAQSFDQDTIKMFAAKWLRYLTNAKIPVHDIEHMYNPLKSIADTGFIEVDAIQFAEAIMRDFFGDPANRLRVLQIVTSNENDRSLASVATAALDLRRKSKLKFCMR
jgi:hypothetical protein